MEAMWAAIAGAALGGILAFVAAEWSFRRARGIAEDEAVRKELHVLDGLINEIAVAMRMAGEESPTALPVAYLHDAMPLRRYMDKAQEGAFGDYAQAALRYNGRVLRIVSYGMGKRAAGLSPGSETPDKHAKLVMDTGPVARDRLVELRDKRVEGLRKK